MSVDTDELRRLAQQATPGPWESRRGYVLQMHIDREVCIADASGGDERDWWDSPRMAANTSYIAAAEPATVLELLDEIDRLRAEVERLTRMRPWSVPPGARHGGGATDDDITVPA